MNKQNKKPNVVKNLGEAYRAIAPFASVGWVFFASIAVSVALGWWIDRRLSTIPIFTLAGAFLGIATGTYNLVVTVKTMGKKDKEEKEEVTK